MSNLVKLAEFWMDLGTREITAVVDDRLPQGVGQRAGALLLQEWAAIYGIDEEAKPSARDCSVCGDFDACQNCKARRCQMEAGYDACQCCTEDFYGQCCGARVTRWKA